MAVQDTVFAASGSGLHRVALLPALIHVHLLLCDRILVLRGFDPVHTETQQYNMLTLASFIVLLFINNEIVAI
jgi:hypothetical protein